MKILKIMLLEKIHSKFGYKSAYIWEIRKYLTVTNRIPKDACSIFLSEIINEGVLEKTDDRTYALKNGIMDDVEKQKQKLKIVRNRTFTKK